MKLRVLRLRLPQDGNIGVGIFPERKEIVIRRPCLSGVALQKIRSRQAEAGKHADCFVDHHTAVLQDLLELGRSLLAQTGRQIRFSSYKYWIE